MNSKELCQWLRDNSSGVYRPSARAADRIERIEETLKAAKVIMEKVAYNNDCSLLWGEYNELRIQSAKIASALDNTEESRGE